MWNKASSRTPVAAFSLPPHPPEGLKAAIDNFERVASAWSDLRYEIFEIKEEAVRAKAGAKATIVEAAKGGTATKVSIPEIEQKYAARIEELEAQAAALVVAVDETGNEMAAAIAEHRSDWLARLQEVAAEQEARYAKGIAETQAALASLTPARGAVQWLENFNHGHATIGSQPQFAGGKITIRHKFPGTFDTDWDPKILLAALKEVVEPSPVPAPAKSRAVAS